jgi:hypothetical protein
MGRRVTGIVAGIMTAAAIAACSSGNGGGSTSGVVQLPSINIAKPDAQITVDGAPIPGLDQSQIGCTRGSGLIASTGTSGTTVSAASVTLQIADTDPPSLSLFSFMADGTEYEAGSETGKDTASVTVSGDRFTVTGSADPTEPATTPAPTKQFEASLTCSKTGN